MLLADGCTNERKLTISHPETSEADDELGPIDFLAVEFPGGVIGASGFEELLDLADRGVISILDLEFIAKHEDGTVQNVSLEDLEPPDGGDLTVWDGASSALLDAADLADIGEKMQGNSVAAVVIFENRWVMGILAKWRQEGARLIADGGLPSNEVLAALDATEQV